MFGNRVLLLLQEYEDGVTPEAVVVKDLDKFDMVFQAHEYETGIGDFIHVAYTQC